MLCIGGNDSNYSEMLYHNKMVFGTRPYMKHDFYKSLKF